VDKKAKYSRPERWPLPSKIASVPGSTRFGVTASLLPSVDIRRLDS